MPTYDYACPSCGLDFEFVHSMSEKPKVLCPSCKSPSKKQISVCAVIVHNTTVQNRVKDYAKKTIDAKRDLAENFGVENVRSVDGSSFPQVYNDIRSRGSFVKDQIQKKKEESERKRRKDNKEWNRQAHKRFPERLKIVKEKRAQEEAKKRAIHL